MLSESVNSCLLFRLFGENEEIGYRNNPSSRFVSTLRNLTSYQGLSPLNLTDAGEVNEKDNLNSDVDDENFDGKLSSVDSPKPERINIKKDRNKYSVANISFQKRSSTPGYLKSPERQKSNNSKTIKTRVIKPQEATIHLKVPQRYIDLKQKEDDDKHIDELQRKKLQLIRDREFSVRDNTGNEVAWNQDGKRVPLGSPTHSQWKETTHITNISRIAPSYMRTTATNETKPTTLAMPRLVEVSVNKFVNTNRQTIKTEKNQQLEWEMWWKPPVIKSTTFPENSENSLPMNSFVLFEIYRKNMDLDLGAVLSIEYCNKCECHQWTTWHDPTVYLQRAEKWREFLAEQLDRYRINHRIALIPTKIVEVPRTTSASNKDSRRPKSASALRKASKTSERVGAFEIQIRLRRYNGYVDHVLHSKIRSGTWPSHEGIFSLLEEMVQHYCPAVYSEYDQNRMRSARSEDEATGEDLQGSEGGAEEVKDSFRSASTEEEARNESRLDPQPLQLTVVSDMNTNAVTDSAVSVVSLKSSEEVQIPSVVSASIVEESSLAAEASEQLSVTVSLAEKEGNDHTPFVVPMDGGKNDEVNGQKALVVDLLKNREANPILVEVTQQSIAAKEGVEENYDAAGVDLESSAFLSVSDGLRTSSVTASHPIQGIDPSIYHNGIQSQQPEESSSNRVHESGEKDTSETVIKDSKRLVGTPESVAAPAASPIAVPAPEVVSKSDSEWFRDIVKEEMGKNPMGHNIDKRLLYTVSFESLEEELKAVEGHDDSQSFPIDGPLISDHTAGVGSDASNTISISQLTPPKTEESDVREDLKTQTVQNHDVDSHKISEYREEDVTLNLEALKKQLADDASMTSSDISADAGNEEPPLSPGKRLSIIERSESRVDYFSGITKDLDESDDYNVVEERDGVKVDHDAIETDHSVGDSSNQSIANLPLSNNMKNNKLLTVIQLLEKSSEHSLNQLREVSPRNRLVEDDLSPISFADPRILPEQHPIEPVSGAAMKAIDSEKNIVNPILDSKANINMGTEDDTLNRVGSSYSLGDDNSYYSADFDH